MKVGEKDDSAEAKKEPRPTLAVLLRRIEEIDAKLLQINSIAKELEQLRTETKASRLSGEEYEKRLARLAEKVETLYDLSYSG